MPINKITADQFSGQLKDGILSRNSSYDVEIGPIPDIIIRPTAQILELQNDRIRRVSQLILLDQSAIFSDEDVNSFVSNENLIRNEGGRSSGTVIFSRASAPNTDLTVQLNFPIASNPDESTGQTVVFTTTEEKTLPFITASSYFNTATQRYELEVPVQATISGNIGEIGPNRINRPLRPLNGFDFVFNRNKTSRVVSRETNNELLERYKISIISTQLSTNGGLKSFIQQNFNDAGDVLIVNADNPLVTRSSTNGGAIDIYITGSQALDVSSNKEFIGPNQLIILDNQPIVSITNIVGFEEGVDFEFVKDTSGVSNSNRAKDGIKFLPAAVSLPIVGSVITINYQYNALIDNIQLELEKTDNKIGGQDPLIRLANQIDIELTADLTILGGFSFATISNAVITTIINFTNNLKLGENVEKSDIQAVVRNITGVDNFVFSIFDRLGGSGNNDIIINSNEFARISSDNIAIV